MTSDLRTALLAFDGKATSLLSEAAMQHRDTAGYLDDLITLIGDPEGHIGDGASWLLKARLEMDNRLSSTQVKSILDRLCMDLNWAAALHVLQSVQHLDPPPRIDTHVRNAIEHYTQHDRPFLRAWALDAFMRLFGANAEYKTQIALLMDHAREDPAASVRARARKLSKELPI